MISMFTFAILIMVGIVATLVIKQISSTDGWVNQHASWLADHIKSKIWILAMITCLCFLLTGVGKRGVPWLYLMFLATLAGSFYWLLYRELTDDDFARKLGLSLGFWLGRVSKLGSRDNCSANSLMVLALVLWCITVLYYVRPWQDSDVKEISQYAVQTVEQSDAAGYIKSVGDFLVKGGEISAIEKALGRDASRSVKPQPKNVISLRPLYFKGPGWISLTLLVSVLAIIDFFLSRRDEALDWLKEVWSKIRKKQEDATAATGGKAGTESSGSAKESTETSSGRGSFIGIQDFVAAFSVSWIEKLAAKVIKK